MDYSSWSEKKRYQYLQNKKAAPTKFSVYACDINPYLDEFFEPIPIH